MQNNLNIIDLYKVLNYWEWSQNTKFNVSVNYFLVLKMFIKYLNLFNKYRNLSAVKYEIYFWSEIKQRLQYCNVR